VGLSEATEMLAANVATGNDVSVFQPILPVELPDNFSKIL
jgi:hypothetical protein